MNVGKCIKTPLSEIVIAELKAGDEVLLSGVIYTARDQAHSRMAGMIERGEDLPFDIDGQVIYYCGPAPAQTGVIGSCGPTTSSRMDLFTPPLLGAGLKGMIGKGSRSPAVVDAIKRHGAVYFLAPAGAGAYIREKVKSCEIEAFGDLGPETVYKLMVEDLPLIVGVDREGRDIYDRLRK